MKLRCFTLAEVLITLGIIGIVAAITMSTIMQKITEKRTVSQLTATYSILSRALRLAVEDNGTVDGWGCIKQDKACAELIANNLKPHLKLLLDCGTNDSKGKCIYNGVYNYKSGSPLQNYATADWAYKVVLLNGTSIWWRGPYLQGDSINSSKNSMLIYVDVNAQKKPNVIGIDMFGFEYYAGSGLVPLGSPLSTQFSYKTACLPKNSNGWGCAYYIMNFKNMDYLH